MNINDLTIGEARAIAALVAALPSGEGSTPAPASIASAKHDTRPVTLTKARMALYWSADVGGVFGLGEKGPTKDCKISAVLPSIILEGVTAIFTVDPAAEKAWNAAKVQGR